MNRRLNVLYWIAGVAIAAIVLAVAFCPAPSGVAAGPASLVGRIAPSFSVARMNGGTGALDDYRGRIVVMNLWATWCPPCRAEMPDLQRLYEHYRARNVVVLGIDEGESGVRAAQFAKALGIAYPILIDSDQRYGRVYAALGMPTTIVIDPQGNVVRGFDGALSYDQMTAALAPLTGRS